MAGLLFFRAVDAEHHMGDLVQELGQRDHAALCEHLGYLQYFRFSSPTGRRGGRLAGALGSVRRAREQHGL